MHPLFGADLPTLTLLARRDGPVSPGHMPALMATFLSALGRWPFRSGETAYLAWKRRQMPPMPPPVFIIGHWRSGTTHLYNILSKGDFGYVSPFAAGLPLEYQTLGRWLRPLLTRMLPRTRYVDQVAVHADSPQEDEIPLGSMTPISFYHGIYFPRQFEHHLHRSLFLEGCDAREIEAWERGFRKFLGRIWVEQGRRPLIKNPTYSARIPQLRRLYPEARFIHIYRNPHDVFRSTRRFYRTLLDRFAWQSYDHLDLDQLVLRSYRRMMERIERDRGEVPEGHFADLRFEDLEKRPIEEIERLFDRLALGDVRPWRPRFEAYLASVQGFRKTAKEEGSNDRMMVERHCSDLLDRLGYAAAGS